MIQRPVKSIPDLSIEAFDIPDTDSQAFVNNMKLGWNLGNTFDAHDCTWLSNKLDYEKGWSGIKTTEEMIQAVRMPALTLYVYQYPGITMSQAMTTP